MTLAFIPFVIIICFLLLCYFVARRNKQLTTLTSTLTSYELNLNKLTSELRLFKEKQAHDVLYDSLTGLPAYQVFEDRLIQTLQLSRRNKLIFAVMFLSLDKFNGELDHGVEDKLIKEVAQRLQDSIRTVDTVCRTNDKFIFIVSQLLKPETAVFVAQRLLEAVSKPIKIQEKEFFLTASIGVATYPSDGDNEKKLMNNANIALQQLESTNAYHFYSADTHELSQHEIKLTEHLQSPDIFNHLVVYYQPVIDVQTQKIVFMDALLHWQHPEFGLIPLSDFLKLAEDNGKIIEIGAWLLKNALTCPYLLSQVAELDTVAVTLSPRQLESPRFAYNLSMMIQEMNFDPHHLVLEVSEIALSMKLDVLEKIFNMLKHIGVQIFLKYFGVGHLSIQHLQSFPIDGIKISRSIIEKIEAKENEQAIRMVVSLCHIMQIKVIAEGVDTLQQKERLKELGCYIMQGNFFCVPLETQSR